MSKSSAQSKSLGCLTVIGIVFVVLKLLAVPPVASWSWLWVLSPFWIGFAIDVVLLLIFVPVLTIIYKALSRIR